MLRGRLGCGQRPHSGHVCWADKPTVEYPQCSQAFGSVTAVLVPNERTGHIARPLWATRTPLYRDGSGLLGSLGSGIGGRAQEKGRPEGAAWCVGDLAFSDTREMYPSFVARPVSDGTGPARLGSPKIDPDRCPMLAALAGNQRRRRRPARPANAKAAATPGAGMLGVYAPPEEGLGAIGDPAGAG